MAGSEDIVIVGAARTPVGSFGGAFGSVPAHELGKVAIQAALERAGVAPDDVDEVIFWLEGLGRIGRKANAGFYAYDDKGKRQGLWEGLAAQYPVAAEQPEVSEVIERLMMAQVLEAVRSFEDHVLLDIREGDVGAILGWGFAPWTGGPFGWLDILGAGKAVEICDRLTAAHGPRFTTPALLRELAVSGDSFYGRFGDGRGLAAA